MLLADWWSVSEAMWLFIGFRLERDSGHLICLRTGESYPEHYRSAELAAAQVDFLNYQQIWTASSHPLDAGIARGLGYANALESEYSKYYFLHWSKKLRVIPELMTLEWLDWAYEQGYLSNADEQRLDDLLNSKVVSISAESELMHSADMLRLIGLLEELLVNDKAQSAAERSAIGFSETAELVQTIAQEAESTMLRVDHGLNLSSLEQTFAQAQTLLRKERELYAGSIFFELAKLDPVSESAAKKTISGARY